MKIMCFIKFRRFFQIFITFGLIFLLIQVYLLKNNNEEISIRKDEIVVLWWTPFGAVEDFRMCRNGGCYFTQNREYLSHRNLKAVLFYGSNVEINDLPIPRRSHVGWGILHEESPRNNLIFVHEDVLSLFNYSSTFSRYSDVPLTLIDLPGEKELLDKENFVPTAEKNRLMREKKLSPLLYLQSNCDTMSERDLYISELMKYISIDSYGACLNNHNLSDNLKINYIESLNGRELMKFVGSYKFTLAFENAVCDDYITEKLWRPLIAGSVPVYYGSPSFRDWLPNNLSAIAVQDFESPRHLAEFIDELMKNDTAYEQYVRHKLMKDGISNDQLLENLRKRPENLFSVFEHHLRSFECAVCEKLHNNNTRVVTKREYNCEKPTRKFNFHSKAEKNWWTDAWEMEKCSGKLLTSYLSENRALQMEDFNLRKMKMYYNNEC